ncbi:MAG: hypothetical protein JXB05_35265 [Myxococcaceae bacterium]|nr:hypothetical protein [Myxococcaceae bacterium]
MMDRDEQLTYLLFLKMAHEQTRPPKHRESLVPKGYDWPSLMALEQFEALQTDLTRC